MKLSKLILKLKQDYIANGDAEVYVPAFRSPSYDPVAESWHLDWHPALGGRVLYLVPRGHNIEETRDSLLVVTKLFDKDS